MLVRQDTEIRAKMVVIEELQQRLNKATRISSDTDPSSWARSQLQNLGTRVIEQRKSLLKQV
jgi:hypothetical protein